MLTCAALHCAACLAWHTWVPCTYRGTLTGACRALFSRSWSFRFFPLNFLALAPRFRRLQIFFWFACLPCAWTVSKCAQRTYNMLLSLVWESDLLCSFPPCLPPAYSTGEGGKREKEKSAPCSRFYEQFAMIIFGISLCPTVLGQTERSAT